MPLNNDNDNDNDHNNNDNDNNNNSSHNGNKNIKALYRRGNSQSDLICNPRPSVQQEDPALLQKSTKTYLYTNLLSN